MFYIKALEKFHLRINQLVFFVLFITNLALRVYLALTFAQYPIQVRAPGSDESGYLNLAAHFTNWLQSGNAVRLPLYPFFLSFFTANNFPELSIYLVQHSLFLLSLFCACWVIFKRRQIAMVVFLAVAYYGPFLTHPNGTLSETFSASMLLFALFAFLKGKVKGHWYIIGSFLLGLVCLSRPDYVLLGFLILCMTFVVSRLFHSRKFVVCMLVFMLPICFWMLRNNLVQGSWVYNTTGWQNIYYRLRNSTIVPICSAQKYSSYFEEAFDHALPENLKMSWPQVAREHKYFDNTNIHVPVGPAYPYKNDVVANKEYRALVRNNLAFYFRHTPWGFSNWLSYWLNNYPTTGRATFEYTTYRNHPNIIIIPVLSALYFLASIYGIIFFLIGFLCVVFCSMKFRLHRETTFAVMYAVLVFAIFLPLATRVGNRFTMIHMILIMISSCYFLLEFDRHKIKPTVNNRFENIR